MQDPYTYTKYFQPSEVYDKTFTKKMIKAIDNLAKELEDNPPVESNWGEIYWAPPFNNPYLDKYSNIIYTFAKLLKVKVMFKDVLNIYSQPIKGLVFIGDMKRVAIMDHICCHYFRGMFEYNKYIHNHLRSDANKAGITDIRVYASQLIRTQLDTIYVYTNNLLEKDIKYQHRLENYIMGQYQLDYKKYNTEDKAYSHATSSSYYHRRMLV